MSDAEMAEIQDWVRAWGRYIAEGGRPDHIPVSPSFYFKLIEYLSDREDVLGGAICLYDDRRAVLLNRIPVIATAEPVSVPAGGGE